MYTNITHNTIEMMMMLNHKMRQDEAAAYRLAKEALGSGMNQGAACRMLAALGKQMMILGARLQSRYGQQEDVSLVLTAE